MPRGKYTLVPAAQEKFNAGFTLHLHFYSCTDIRLSLYQPTLPEYCKNHEKMGSTNYYNTFIEVAEDCPAEAGQIPPQRGTGKSVANLQFEMFSEHPYEYTSDDIFFAVYALRKDLTEAEMAAEREKFFAKGQPCFRASPLTKRYGWGVHSNAEGKVAMYGRETPEYERFLRDPSLEKTKAMRTKRS